MSSNSSSFILLLKRTPFSIDVGRVDPYKCKSAACLLRHNRDRHAPLLSPSQFAMWWSLPWFSPPYGTINSAETINDRLCGVGGVKRSYGALLSLCDYFRIPNCDRSLTFHPIIRLWLYSEAMCGFLKT